MGGAAYLGSKAMTDLRKGQIGAPRSSFLCRLITNLKSTKLRRGISPKCTWKREKIQMS